MRVLMTADAIGGVWTYAVELAQAMAPYGVEVHLATMGRRLSPVQQEQASAFAAVHETDLPLEWMPEPWAGVDAAGDWLLGLEDQVRPDVVHLNGYVHAVLPFRAPVLVVAHSDVASWWHWVHAAPPPAEWDDYRRRVQAGLHAAACVVAPTGAVAADLAREYGTAGVAVVPNCRSIEVPHLPRQRLVLGAGRIWDEAKDLAALARVATRVDARVVVAGEGRLAGGELAGVELTGVELLGALPPAELVRWLARATVFCSPARYEPFGLGILEAALAGCALVLRDLPSLREVWGSKATWFHSDDELADALAAALEAPVSARDCALTYSRARTATGYLEQYARLPVRTGGTR